MSLEKNSLDFIGQNDAIIFHEIMDRTSIISHNFEVFVREALVEYEDQDKVIYRKGVDGELSTLVDEISNKLFNLYQMLGNISDE